MFMRLVRTYVEGCTAAMAKGSAALETLAAQMLINTHAAVVGQGAGHGHHELAALACARGSNVLNLIWGHTQCSQTPKRPLGYAAAYADRQLC